MMIVNSEKCIGCGQCVKDCFPKDIEITYGKAKINNVTCVKCGHCIAVCPKNAVYTDEYSMEDIKNYNKEHFSIDPDNLLNFIKFRRTVRQFNTKDIEEDKISKIIEAGRYTQTGSNMQDVSFIIVKDRIQELKKLTLESLKTLGENLLTNLTPQDMGFKRYIEMWVEMYEDFKANPEKNDKLFHNAPMVIIVTANSDVHGALASSNMELMINALGLGTFFCGSFVRAAQDNEKMTKFLNIKEGKKIVACMVVGYPNVKYFRTVPRKKADITLK